MTGLGNRNKGANGELEVRDLITPWWQRFEPGTKFVRTPLSGGWGGAGEFRAAGDLMVPSGSRWPWAVEVKRREGWSPAALIAGHRSPVWGWWQQTIEAAEKNDQQPMLWARRSHGEWIVLVPFAQVAHIAGAPAPRYAWGDLVARARGLAVLPVGYWGADILRTDPKIWV